MGFWLRASTLETFVLAASAVGAFFFSGISNSPNQWVFRHCLWHVIAGFIGTYGALRMPPEGATIWKDGKLMAVFISTFSAYVFISGLCLLLWILYVPAERRDHLWRIG